SRMHAHDEGTIMINRREVIASGLAASVLAAAAPSLAGSAGMSSARAVRLFVADSRIPESAVAARAAELRGAAIGAVPGDVTRLYESLDLAWRRAPFAVAGLTTKSTLFVIERLAWERGLRTAYRGIHRRRRDGKFEHALAGSSALLDRIGLGTEPGDLGIASAWVAAVGRALAEWTADRPDHRPAMAQTLPGEPEAAASWLLVPRAE